MSAARLVASSIFAIFAGACGSEAEVLLEDGLMESGSAIVVPCGASVVNNEQIDAAPAIRACLDSAPAGGVVALEPGRYFLRSTLALDKRHAWKTLQTKNATEAMPACAPDDPTACAILVAHSSLVDIMLAGNPDHFTLLRIVIDGNNGARHHSICRANLGAGANVSLGECHGCRILGIATVRAVCKTGLSFWGDDGLIARSLFKDNGTGVLNLRGKISSQDPPNWADGLTALRATRATIVDNRFEDNSDINLIVGGAPDAQITGNVLVNTWNFSFASLMLDNFGNAPSPGWPWGQYVGAEISNNTVDCGPDALCGFGIMVGPANWPGYTNPPPVTDVAVVANTVRRARQGVMVYKAQRARLEGNDVDLMGSYVLPNGARTTFIDLNEAPDALVLGSRIPASRGALAVWHPADLAQATSVGFEKSVQVHDFVTRLYRQYLGRAPDGGGLGYWISAVLGGTSTRAQAEQAFINSAEANAAATFERRQRQGGVTALYYDCLHRAPDSGGLQYWQSQPFASAYYSLCVTSGERQSVRRTEFVQELYRRCLGREADPGGLAYWRDQPPSTAELGVCRSAEARARLKM